MTQPAPHPTATMSDADLLAELDHALRKRLDTVRHGSDSAIENSTRRQAELEGESAPSRTMIDPMPAALSAARGRARAAAAGRLRLGLKLRLREVARVPDGDVRDTRWRYSLMNWGHDPEET